MLSVKYNKFTSSFPFVYSSVAVSIAAVFVVVVVMHAFQTIKINQTSWSSVWAFMNWSETGILEQHIQISERKFSPRSKPEFCSQSTDKHNFLPPCLGKLVEPHHHSVCGKVVIVMIIGLGHNTDRIFGRHPANGLVAKVLHDSSYCNVLTTGKDTDHGNSVHCTLAELSPTRPNQLHQNRSLNHDADTYFPDSHPYAMIRLFVSIETHRWRLTMIQVTCHMSLLYSLWKVDHENHILAAFPCSGSVLCRLPGGTETHRRISLVVATRQ